MKLKLLALSGIMAASMGLAACDSNKENAAEDVADAQEELQDAQEEIQEGAVEGEPVADAAAEVDAAAAAADEAAAATATTEMDAEVPADGTEVVVADPMATDTAAVEAADGDVAVVEGEAPAAQ